MFAVLFEVRPRSEQWDAYLGYARLLRPELERIDGFIDNIRYGSLRRPGWLLSLSSWRNEKALVRWRTHAVHHGVQEKGRREVFQDYHLRVGQFTADNHPLDAQSPSEQRLDETETGASKSVSIIEAKRPRDLPQSAAPEALAARLGFSAEASGLVDWDVFDAILAPGDLLLMLSWRDTAAAEAGEKVMDIASGSRRRRIRVVRDYGMFDRREAAQYYPAVTRGGG